MTPATSFPNLLLEYRLWDNELNYYREEITIFEHHLYQIISNGVPVEAAALVEYFQEQFVHQRAAIDELKHDVQAAQKHLTSTLRRLSIFPVKRYLLNNCNQFSSSIQSFRNGYNELKCSFRLFESEWWCAD